MSEMLSQDPTDEARKSSIIAAVREFIESRPGFEWANYVGCPEAYRADYRRALRDLHDARELLRLAEVFLPGDYIIKSMSQDKRLTIVENKVTDFASKFNCEYTTCQYYPVEYRAAACRALSAAIWDWLRDQCGHRTGDSIRDSAANFLGKRLAARWFR